MKIGTALAMGLAAAMGCSSGADQATPGNERPTMRISMDGDVYSTWDTILEASEEIVIATPVGIGTHEPVETKTPVLANFFRDLAISRTIYGTLTGVVSVGTTGWNPDSPIPPEEIAIEAGPFEMIGEIPEGPALFFLSKVPGERNTGKYWIIGDGFGHIPIYEAEGTWKTVSGAKVPEFADRDLRDLIREIRADKDKWRR